MLLVALGPIGVEPNDLGHLTRIPDSVLVLQPDSIPEFDFRGRIDPESPDVARPHMARPLLLRTQENARLGMHVPGPNTAAPSIPDPVRNAVDEDSVRPDVLE
jgi:hypothetical protein